MDENIPNFKAARLAACALVLPIVGRSVFLQDAEEKMICNRTGIHTDFKASSKTGPSFINSTLHFLLAGPSVSRPALRRYLPISDFCAAHSFEKFKNSAVRDIEFFIL